MGKNGLGDSRLESRHSFADNPINLLNSNALSSPDSICLCRHLRDSLEALKQNGFNLPYREIPAQIALFTGLIDGRAVGPGRIAVYTFVGAAALGSNVINAHMAIITKTPDITKHTAGTCCQKCDQEQKRQNF